MRKLTLARLALTQLRRQSLLAAAQCIGLTAAVALAATVGLMQAAAAEAGLRSAIAASERADYVEIQRNDVFAPDAFKAFEDDATAKAGQAMGGYLKPGARYISSGSLGIYERNGQQVQIEAPNPLATYYESLEKHVQLVAGTWPVDPPAAPGNLPFSLSATTAERLRTTVGETLCVRFLFRNGLRNVQGTPEGFCGTVQGIWRPLDPGDPYWAGNTPDNNLMLGRAGFFKAAAAMPDGTFRAGQVYVPDLSSIHAANAADVSGRLARMRGLFGVSNNATFISGLDRTINAYLAQLWSSEVAALIVAVALLAIALYSVAFVAIHFLEGQRTSLALWRARGWSQSRIWRLLMLQFGLLALIAVPVGGAAALILVHQISEVLFPGHPQLGLADLATLGPALAAALLIGAGLLASLSLLESRRSLLEARRAGSGGRPWWRRRHLDLILAGLALPLLAEVRFRGAAEPGAQPAGTDPLTLLLPGLALALLALASLRLLPLAARLVRGAGGLPGTLAGWQLERQPGQYARLALLLSFAIAIGLFASAYAATDRHNAIDRSGYEAGSDLRASFARGDQPPLIDQAVASVPNVLSSAKVFRGSGRPGRSDLDTTVLGIDGDSFWRTAWQRGDLATDSVGALTRRLSALDPDGVVLPGRPTSLLLDLYSSGVDGRLEAELTDSGGGVLKASFGSLASTGWQQLEAPLPRDDGAATLPRKLRSLTITGTGSRTEGELALGSLRSTGEGAAPLQDFRSSGGWWQSNSGSGLYLQDLAPSPRRSPAGNPVSAVVLHLDRGTVSVHPAPADRPLPALLSTQTLRKLGLHLGQSFPLHIDANDVQVTPVGELDYFPTLYPSQEDFMILDRTPLLDRLIHQNAAVWTNEAWLRVQGPTEPAAKALTKNDQVVRLTDRQQLQAVALANPLRVSLDAELVIGFIAALGMVVIGFGLHFAVATRSRVSQYAILQANGLPWSAVRRSLVAEQALLLGYSLAVGAGMGLLLAWVILPVLQLSNSPQDLIPPTLLQVDAVTAAAAILVVAIAGAVAGQLASRLGSRFDLLTELRSLN